MIHFETAVFDVRTFLFFCFFFVSFELDMQYPIPFRAFRLIDRIEVTLTEISEPMSFPSQINAYRIISVC